MVLLYNNVSKADDKKGWTASLKKGSNAQKIIVTEPHKGTSKSSQRFYLFNFFFLGRFINLPM